MGIQIEFNPDLALRNFSNFKNGKRDIEECLPEKIEVNKVYNFLKSGQRNYWMLGELPLLETKGNAILSRPIASIVIIEVTHYLKNKLIFTKGKYKVVEVFKDNKIHFESYAKVGERYS
jgi:hypothetical protein